MKIRLLLLGLGCLLVLAFTGCSSTNSNQIQASLGQQFTLPVGQTAVLNGENLSFQFVKVSGDSRCQKGVQCIQAGDAKCDMQFTYNNIASEVTLTDKGGTDGFTQSSYNQYNLSFRVDPYPEADKTISAADYKLLMTVTK
ncbi:MAG TPA: hypothetical protein VF318_00845 [Dehalococcoidales bacterium]